MIHIKNVTEWEKGDSDKAIYNILKYKDMLANKELEYNELLYKVNKVINTLYELKFIKQNTKHANISLTEEDIDNLIQMMV